jgi:hypothetical protein
MDSETTSVPELALSSNQGYMLQDPDRHVIQLLTENL